MTKELCSCSGKKPDGDMTPVKDDSGNITGYERRYHNDNGDITRWDIYDADQVYQSYVLYEYDNHNRLISEITYLANGITLTVLGITAAMMIFALINYAIVFFKIQKQLKNSDNNASVQASITDNK